MEPGPPHRPVLRPGLRVVRRDDRHLQIGLHLRERVVLPDVPAVRQLLAQLAAATPPDREDPVARRWYDELLARDLVVDADALTGPVARSLPAAAVAAAYAESGPAATPRLAARAAARIDVDCDEPWRGPTARLLTSSGLRVAGAGEEAVVHLLVGAAARIDDLARADRPHLVVTTSGGRVTVGPLVVPGLTACVRCVEAHRCDRDPRFAALLRQLREGEHGPDPVDPVLMQLALAWAVHDLVRFVDGDPPSTWSSTVAISPGTVVESHRWARHPACGCAWGDNLAAG